MSGARRTRVGATAVLLAGALHASAATLVDLQPFASRYASVTAAGQPVELINLNPNIGAQYVLRVAKSAYHLQFPPGSEVALVADGLRYAIPGSAERTCKLDDGKRWSLDRKARAAFVPICGGRVYLRRALNGWKQKIKATAAMRQAWASWTPAQREIYTRAIAPAARDKHGPSHAQRPLAGIAAPPRPAAKSPPPARLKAEHAQTTLRVRQLGIEVAGMARNKLRLRVGQWYPAKHFDDMHVSVIKLAHIEPTLLKTFGDRVKSLAANGGRAQINAEVYLVAMDLDRYTFNWVHGTDHPGVAWSRRHRLRRSNRHGPDGFSKLKPFVPSAAVSPVDLPATVGTFSGGFQRRHGAFKWGKLAKTADAHHYGFMEDGVILSTLMPGLATVIGYRDGSTVLKTWTRADVDRLPGMRYARQNGVPLMIDGDGDTVGVPGLLVGNWGHGNWSGSAKAELRTPRSAACLIEDEGKRWLAYAYFFTHTPSGMARVLQAYQCDYAVHLDMNSPGHAYFALFTRMQPEPETLDYRIEHLMTQMKGWDPHIDRKRTPRYLLKPEYKDFFYIMRRD